MKKGMPRLQHYVPQFLLRRFANQDGKVWAYDAERKKMFCTAPKNLAAEEYFYDPGQKHATAASAAIENWLATEIDGPGADAIAALLSKRKLSLEQLQAFFKFIAAQLQRTPASLQRIADHFTPIFQETAERIGKYHSEARTNIVAAAKAAGNTDEDVRKLTQILDEGAFTTAPAREFTISTTLQGLQFIAQELALMKWTFASVPDSEGDLILGDHPVTLADVGAVGAPLGIKNPNIEIAMPLCPRVVALAHWDGPIAYGELASGVGEMLNARTLSQIQRFVFASFESKTVLENAVTLRGTGPKMRTRRIQDGGKLIILCEFR